MFNWRDHLDVHPAADLFPLMSESELKELAEDIKKTGMAEPVVLFHTKEGQTLLLDGRNRLDALASLGSLHTPGGLGFKMYLNAGHTFPVPSRGQWEAEDRDPYALALTYNIHRRHLTAEQRRDLIAKVLKATPEKSNNQIAKDVKVDDKTVAKVRADLESTSDIPKLEKTVGKDGKARKQPAKRKKPDKVKAINGQSVSTDGKQIESVIAGLPPSWETPATGKPEPIESTADASAEARKALYADPQPKPEQRVVTKTDVMGVVSLIAWSLGDGSDLAIPDADMELWDALHEAAKTLNKLTSSMFENDAALRKQIYARGNAREAEDKAKQEAERKARRKAAA